MAVTGWLVDRSAYVRMQLRQVVDADERNRRIERGLLRVSTITRLSTETRWSFGAMRSGRTDTSPSSAGSKPGNGINAVAVQAMAEEGIRVDWFAVDPWGFRVAEGRIR